MNDKTKDEIRKNTATGMSAVLGGTIGTVATTAIKDMTADAHEIEAPEPLPEPAPEPKPEPKPQPSPEKKPEPKPIENPEEKTDGKNDGGNEQHNNEGQETNDELEVVAYERVTNEDGSQMDVAVVKVDDMEMGVLDFDLDNRADAIVCDANQNGVLDEGEVQIVEGQGISMTPFQQAAGFNPLFAQNDLPDYVNDSDVDPYMA